MHRSPDLGDASFRLLRVYLAIFATKHDSPRKDEARGGMRTAMHEIQVEKPRKELRQLHGALRLGMAEVVGKSRRWSSK
jgi:hypothetical protein